MFLPSRHLPRPKRLWHGCQSFRPRLLPEDSHAVINTPHHVVVPLPGPSTNQFIGRCLFERRLIPLPVGELAGHTAFTLQPTDVGRQEVANHLTETGVHLPGTH